MKGARLETGSADKEMKSMETNVLHSYERNMVSPGGRTCRIRKTYK
jgi:hypothetical protein